MADREVHAKLFVELALIGAHVLEDKLIIECAWAVVAIKKYGITIADGALMVKQNEALRYVFHCYMTEQTKPDNIDAFLDKFPPVDIIASVDKNKMH